MIIHAHWLKMIKKLRIITSILFFRRMIRHLLNCESPILKDILFQVKMVENGPVVLEKKISKMLLSSPLGKVSSPSVGQL